MSIIAGFSPAPLQSKCRHPSKLATQTTACTKLDLNLAGLFLERAAGSLGIKAEVSTVAVSVSACATGDWTSLGLPYFHHQLD